MRYFLSEEYIPRSNLILLLVSYVKFSLNLILTLQDCVSSMMKSVDALFAKLTAIGIAITIFLPFQIILVIFLVRCVPSDPVYQ